MKSIAMRAAAAGAGLVLSVMPGCTTAGSAGLGAVYARGCLEAAERKRAPGSALRLCDSALLDAALPARERAATHVNRGIVHMQARNVAAALADYDTAIRIAPNAAEAYVNKGIALIGLGDRDAEAVRLFDAALARNPLRPAIAYYSRAIANEQLGRTRAAYEDYSRAAQLDPDWPDPAAQLQRFRVLRGKTASG